MNTDHKYKPGEGMANKSHVRLRSPDVAVSTVDFGSAGEFVTVLLTVDAFELDHGLFNGACLEMKKAEAVALHQRLGKKLGL